jgi:hypothetical protein
MKRTIIFTLFLLIIVGGYFFLRQNQSIPSILSLRGCTIKENSREIMPVSIAQVFAQKHVITNNKPFNWVPVGYYPVYNSSDSINYYAFVFRKSDYTELATLSGLEQNASNYSNKPSEYDKLEYDNKYQFKNIASVWTGASSGQKLLMHHYRGLPEIVAEKIRIRNFVENKNNNKTIGNIIADSEAGRMYFDIVNKANNKSTGEVIGINYSIVSKNKLVNNQKKIRKRRYAHLSDDECKKMKQMILEREVYLRKQWDEVGN